MKKVLGWPREIYFFLIAEFVKSLEFVGVILLVFFKDWGGLSQLEVQSLQSWFLILVFLLEIPTGIFADIRGKKMSVILGHLMTILGFLLYSIEPNIYLFFLAESILGIGLALQSGAQEGWLYSRVKQLGVERYYRDIISLNSNMKMGGFLLASLCFPLIPALDLPIYFRISVIPIAIAIGILFLIKDEKVVGDDDEELGWESYKNKIKEGGGKVIRDKSLRNLTIYATILGTAGYFVLWLFQAALIELNVPLEQFGWFRIVLLLAQIIMIWVMGIMVLKNMKKGMWIIGVIVALGFLTAGVIQAPIGIIILLLFSGGFGLQVRQVISQEINQRIEEKERATVLSFIGMIRRTSLIVLNPLVGVWVDKGGVFVVFLFLGVISLSSLFFCKKKNK